MTYAQRVMDERRFAYAEGEAADHAKGQAEGRVQGVKEGVAAYVTGCFAVVFGAMKSTLKSLVTVVPQSIQRPTYKKGRYIKLHKPAQQNPIFRKFAGHLRDI